MIPVRSCWKKHWECLQLPITHTVPARSKNISCQCSYSRRRAHIAQRYKKQPRRWRPPYWHMCNTKMCTNPYPKPTGGSRGQNGSRCIWQIPPGSIWALLSGSWGNWEIKLFSSLQCDTKCEILFRSSLLRHFAYLYWDEPPLVLGDPPVQVVCIRNAIFRAHSSMDFRPRQFKFGPRLLVIKEL